jgi:hypothetical protein
MFPAATCSNIFRATGTRQFGTAGALPGRSRAG